MEWLQVMTIAGSTIGACWYLHKDSMKELKNFSQIWADESKDFHGRLCKLEEKYQQMMERLLEKNKK